MQQNDQPEEASKSADDDIEDAESQSLPKMEPPYRFQLGRSQKKRSKLVQNTEETSAVTPPPAPGPEAPKTEPALPAKRVRLKRSGQMHEDLTGPIPDEPPRRSDEY